MTFTDMKLSMPLLFALVFAANVAAPLPAHAELPPAAQAQVEKYKKKLVEWAKNPLVVGAVKQANASEPAPGMSNAKWESLPDNDAAVMAVLTNPAGKLLTELEADTGISKLYLRDSRGNIIAASNKPLLYSIASRPAMTTMTTGQPWAQKEVKPDPTTQVKSVQLAVPVMDGDKPIGVLHTGVTIE